MPIQKLKKRLKVCHRTQVDHENFTAVIFIDTNFPLLATGQLRIKVFSLFSAPIPSVLSYVNVLISLSRVTVYNELKKAW